MTNKTTATTSKMCINPAKRTCVTTPSNHKTRNTIASIHSIVSPHLSTFVHAFVLIVPGLSRSHTEFTTIFSARHFPWMVGRRGLMAGFVTI